MSVKVVTYASKFLFIDWTHEILNSEAHMQLYFLNRIFTHQHKIYPSLTPLSLSYLKGLSEQLNLRGFTDQAPPERFTLWLGEVNRKHPSSENHEDRTDRQLG